MNQTIITYLEMRAAPANPAPALPDGVSIMQAVQPTVGFYRFLYNEVGKPWNWKDRNKLEDEALRRIIQHPEVALHVLYVQGTPAGFVELDYRKPPDAQVAYFGLMPDFIGRKLGRFFLEWAVSEAWQRKPQRLWVHTCTQDHPGALPLYEKVGFKPYASKAEPL